MPTKARSPHWALAGIAVCGSCGGRMYCTSSQRGEQYALYCGTARISRVCKGVYRTRAAAVAAVEAWLQSITRVLKTPSRIVLLAPPAVQKHDPFKAERRKLLALLDGANAKVGRLLDAYTDGIVDLAEYKSRREGVQHDVERAQARLAELDVPAPSEPTAASLSRAGNIWATLSADGRRDICHDFLKEVRVNADKSVVIVPLWDDPAVTITFSKRNTAPVPPQPPRL